LNHEHVEHRFTVAAIESFDKAILHRFAWFDELQSHPVEMTDLFAYRESQNRRPARLTAFLEEEENFLYDLSNSVRPFDYIVKVGQLARPTT